MMQYPLLSQSFRAGEILVRTTFRKSPDGASWPKSEQAPPFLRNVTKDDNRSHF